MTRTRNALDIIRKDIDGDPELKELVEQERINLQVALAIREARKAEGLTQNELAEKIGTSQSVISRLEDTDYDGYTLKTLIGIAEALNRRIRFNLEPIETKASDRGNEGKQPKAVHP